MPLTLSVSSTSTRSSSGRKGASTSGPGAQSGMALIASRRSTLSCAQQPPHCHPFNTAASEQNPWETCPPPWTTIRRRINRCVHDASQSDPPLTPAGRAPRETPARPTDGPAAILRKEYGVRNQQADHRCGARATRSRPSRALRSSIAMDCDDGRWQHSLQPTPTPRCTPRRRVTAQRDRREVGKPARHR